MSRVNFCTQSVDFDSNGLSFFYIPVKCLQFGKDTKAFVK